MSAEKSSRLSSDDRREQILDAATAVFGERGYVGGTTDAIARAAGISQAYVVRMFGSKEDLFAEVCARAGQRVAEAFRAAIAQFTPDSTVEDKLRLLGETYGYLIADRGTLLSLMHAFTQGADPKFGPLGRDYFLNAFRIVRDEAGMGGAQTTAFFAQGMLINTLLAMRMPDVYDDTDADELMKYAFGEKCDDLLTLVRSQAIMADAVRA